MPGFNPFAGGKVVINQLLNGGGLVNQGGIGIAPGNNLRQAFPNVRCVPPFRSRAGNDSDQQLQVGYDVPWSQAVAWEQWMLGYSSTLAVFNANPGGGDGAIVLQGGGVGAPIGGQFGGGGAIQNNPGVQPVAPAQWFLSRAIPYQCKVIGREHLYCSNVECSDVAGAWQSDPGVFEHDAFGAVQAGPGGQALTEEWIRFYENGTNKDGVAHYVATFTPRDYEIRYDAELAANQPNQGELERYVSKTPRSAIQSLPLPAGTYKFAQQLSPVTPNALLVATGPIAANAAFQLLPTDELVYTWHEVPDEPVVAIANCQGAVNAAAFDGARGRPSYPTGTLLCQAPLERKRYRHCTGRWYWRITYSLLYRPQGHNYFPNGLGGFQYVTATGNIGGANDLTIYPSADFNQLFVAPPPLAPTVGWPGG